MKKDADRYKNRLPSKWIETIEDNYQRVRNGFEIKDKKGRVRLVNKWYQPDVSNIADMCKEVDLEVQYEEGYRPLSSLEHSDAAAYIPMIGGMATGGATAFNVHNDLFAPPYLRNAFQYFADIMSICIEGLKSPAAEQMRQVVSDGMEFFSQEARPVKLEEQD